MKTQILSLVLSVLLVGCVRGRCPPPVQREDDRSIVLPRFFEQRAVEVGAGGQPYELEGVVLRALMIAANDHRPPGDEELPCMYRQERQRYRVIRRGDIVFVHIEEDPESCGLQYIMLHSGVTYAISTDGRILRRVTAGSLEGMSDLALPEEGASPPTPLSTPPAVDAPGGESSLGEPPSPQGSGAAALPPAPPAPTPLPDGGP